MAGGLCLGDLSCFGCGLGRGVDVALMGDLGGGRILCLRGLRTKGRVRDSRFVPRDASMSWRDEGAGCLVAGQAESL